MMHSPDQFRFLGTFGSPMSSTRERDGNNGSFFIPVVTGGRERFRVIASDGGGWEHVSVSLPSRVPTWAEMCEMKLIFWDPEDVVMQLHPPQSQWVNCHPFCLHLWRPIGVPIPLPPIWMVGPKS